MIEVTFYFRWGFLRYGWQFLRLREFCDRALFKDMGVLFMVPQILINAFTIEMTLFDDKY